MGGVAAGMSAASRARRASATAKITVLERGPVAAYGACGLPLWLGGEVGRLEELLAHPAEFFRDQRKIDVLTGHEALELEPGRHRVRARTPAGERWLHYDRLVLATGATGRWQPPAPPRNLFAANTWEQALGLDAALRSAAEPIESMRRLAVVGAGYIGLEVAQALARRGLEVTLVDAHATPLHGFDDELAAILPPLIEAAGIAYHPGTRVLGLEGPAGGWARALATSAGMIACDAIVNCGGLRPETGLAAAAGVALGGWGGIAVDERQQTNLAGIFAAGDCAETRHLVTGAAVWIPLGTAANKQGRVAGQNAAGGSSGGRPARFPGVLGTLAVPLFGAEWGRTGLTLAQGRAAGFDAAAQEVTAGTRARYMEREKAPATVTVKIVYDRGSGRLLGCHLRGAPGTVTGRLDAAAVALTARLELEQIESLDFAYAPAMAPLYEPLAIAAHVARRSA